MAPWNGPNYTHAGDNSALQNRTHDRPTIALQFNMYTKCSIIDTVDEFRPTVMFVTFRNALSSVSERSEN